MATGAAPDSDLQKAAEIDGTKFSSGPRTDYEVTVMYAITAAAPMEIAPMDGTHITTGVLCLSPTSRGTVTLASNKAIDNPIIDPRYFTTEHDRAVMRAAMRICLRAMESAPLKDYIEGETPPPGMPSINSSSSDAELDKRVNAVSWSWYHTAGTASMGKVVDTQCRVYGVQGLRVVDTSIMPLSITAHLQAPMYAIAESAADLIAQAACYIRGAVSCMVEQYSTSCEMSNMRPVSQGAHNSTSLEDRLLPWAERNSMCSAKILSQKLPNPSLSLRDAGVVCDHDKREHYYHRDICMNLYFTQKHC